MSDPSGKRDVKTSVKRSMIVGGCVSGLFGPMIAILPCALILGISSIRAGDSSILSGIEAYFGILIFSFIFGFFIPAALTGIFIGWLGVRFRRGRTICCGVAAGMLLSFLHGAVLYGLADSDFSECIGFGIVMMIMAILPSIALSWWLHRWIEKRSARCDDALAG